MKKSEREALRTEAIEYLRTYVPAGSTLLLSLSKVSRSGMSRTIKVLHENQNISFYVAHATENRLMLGMSGGVLVSGCGMDMGLALVESLSYAVFGKPCQQLKNMPTGGYGFKWV